ncbi:hypothetical protein [Nonlabens sp. Asnod2-A12]|uniref:hypothetical protein n=1 Tax=Nonlabens sp. Asnod2-A12 TaxID=3160578 RepID=UPI00386FEBF2
MKKIITFLLLFPSLLFAQLHVDDTWSNEVNPIFNNLDKTKITSGILIDYAMEFTDLSAYNGVVTDTNYVDVTTVGNIYKTYLWEKWLQIL